VELAQQHVQQQAFLLPALIIWDFVPVLIMYFKITQ
jgi:hypothetical protein